MLTWLLLALELFRPLMVLALGFFLLAIPLPETEAEPLALVDLAALVSFAALILVLLVSLDPFLPLTPLALLGSL